MAHTRPRCVTETAERRRERAGIPDSTTWAAALDALIPDADDPEYEEFREWAATVAARRTLERVAAIDVVWHRRGGRMHYDA